MQGGDCLDCREGTSCSEFTMKKRRFYNYLQIEEDDDDKGLMLEGFATNLRKIRTARNLTQEQLGALAKINYKYLGELERNVKSPSAVVICKLSRALGVPVCELLTTDGCPIARREFFKEFEELIRGKDGGDLEKAIRILEVFFE